MILRIASTISQRTFAGRGAALDGAITPHSAPLRVEAIDARWTAQCAKSENNNAKPQMRTQMIGGATNGKRNISVSNRLVTHTHRP